MLYRFGKFSLDTQLYQLENDNGLVSVEPQVFDLLVYLIENRDRVVPRDELLDNVWKGRVVGDAALNGRLKAVRKAIGDTGRSQSVIKTVHGRGYQFVCPVSESARAVAQIEPAQTHADNKTELASRTGISSGKPSILVFPFTNKSSDPDDG